MIEINTPHAIVMFLVFSYALYYTWNRALAVGFDEGYGAACADVAQGNITVSLIPPEDIEDDDYYP